MVDLGYNYTSSNHIKSSGSASTPRYPLFSSRNRGADTMPDHTPFFPQNLEDYAPWVAIRGLVAPYGECQCGCGEIVPVSDQNDFVKGLRFNHPKRFIASHTNSKSRSIEVAFWRNVVPGAPNECWEWRGTINAQGYGTFKHRGQRYLAHRVSYELHLCSLLIGELACHTCDNRKCVNPNHLFSGTNLDNIRDMVAKGRNPFGQRIHTTKLQESDVLEIRRLFREGMSKAELGRRYGVHSTNIDALLRGQTWRHVK